MGVDCPLTLNRGGNMFIARWIVEVRFGQKTKFNLNSGDYFYLGFLAA